MRVFSRLNIVALLFVGFQNCQLFSSVGASPVDFPENKPVGFLAEGKAPLLKGKSDSERWALVGQNLSTIATANMAELEKMLGVYHRLTPPGSKNSKYVVCQWAITESKVDAKPGETVFFQLSCYFEDDVPKKCMIQPVRMVDPASLGL